MARQLRGSQPAEFAELRRHMEAGLGMRGRREYVGVPSLLRTFPLAEVSAAIRQAQVLAIGETPCAVRHRAVAAEAGSEELPHLPASMVALTRAADYRVLMQAGTE